MTPKAFLTVVSLALFSTAGTGFAQTSSGLTLETALQLLRKNSPDLQLAQKRISQAEEAIAAANATFWPTVHVGVDYGVTNNSAMAFGSILNQKAFSPTMNFNDVSSVDNLRLRATVKVPIYMGGSRFYQKDAQRANRNAAKAQAGAIGLALEYHLARAYYSIHKARAFQKTAAAMYKAIEENLRVAKQRATAGTLLRQDLLAVELQLTQAKERVLRAKNAYSLAGQALRRILGIKGATPSLAEQVSELAYPTQAKATKRYETAALEQGGKAATAMASAARAGYWPQLAAFGSVYFDHGFIEDGNKLSYMAGLSLNWQVWDGFATRSKVRQADVSVSLVQQQLRKQALTFTYETKEARLQYENANERLAVAKEAIRLAEERAKLTRALFRQGLALSTQLIDAEAALNTSRLAADEVRASRSISIAALRKALGLRQLQK